MVWFAESHCDGVDGGGAAPCRFGKNLWYRPHAISSAPCSRSLHKNMSRHPGLSKKILIGVSAVTVVVLVVGLLLALWVGHVLREVVTDQFNDQQLSVARGAKHLVERELNELRKTLVTLARNFAESPGISSTFSDAESKLFSQIVLNGVRKVELVDVYHKKKWAYLSYRRTAMEGPLDEDSLPKIPPGFFGEESVWTSLPVIKGSDVSMTLAAPIPKDSSRMVLFDVDISWFLEPYLKDLRSGKTGYALVMDNRGTFLFHPNVSFIGTEAFLIRRGPFPEQFIPEINQIQRDRMLEGREGTGSYISGWHRGITGEVEKLIAYTPLRVSNHPSQIWSIAVVAPVYEIEDEIRKNQYWQLLFLGLVIGVVLLASGAILVMENRWSRTLEKQVVLRTEALKRSEENYRSLVESAEDFIFTLDRQGDFLSVNSFTAKFLGCSPHVLVGRGFHTVFEDEVAQPMVQRVRLVFETGKSIPYEFEMKTGDQPIWLSANLMPLRNEAGEISAALCIARNITENKKLEKQLISTEKLASLGTLAAGVAHEINNPLGVILGFCDLIIRKKEPGSLEYEDLKVIERQGLYCKEITENLLSFVRLNVSEDDLVDIEDSLAEIIKIGRHAMEMKGIELVKECAKDLAPVRGDPRQLQQVFMNLITNAVAAMENGGKITIRTGMEKGNRRAVVQIEDEGIGIPPENLERIYDPFFTTKPEGEGTGLGLFVSYGIISKYGGVIECESHTANAPGQKSGTIFTIKLPIWVRDES